MNEKLVIKALNGWHSLLATINDLTEEECRAALDIERTHRRRKMVMIKLHQRYSRLRMHREREALLTGETN